MTILSLCHVGWSSNIAHGFAAGPGSSLVSMVHLCRLGSGIGVNRSPEAVKLFQVGILYRINMIAQQHSIPDCCSDMSWYC